MVRSGGSFLLSAAFAVLLFALPVEGQTGSINGVVRDGRGTAQARARVTVTNQATAAVQNTTTGIDGAYRVTDLAAGTYSVSVALVGYAQVVHEDVQVRAGASVSLDITLEALRMEDITVTAMLREQQLIEVPFSIAAATEADLRARGADNLEAIAANVAGFSVQNLGPGQTQVAMRGASAGQIARDQPGVKEQVGSYLDDVPISLSLFTPDLDLFDVERVEVLRGPQGTLYGSGSLAGTVRYISKQPVLGENSVFGEVGGSWIDGGAPGNSAKLGFNVPLSDQVAFRVVGYSTLYGGYMDAVQPNLQVEQDVNGGVRSGIRAALRLQPNDRLTITPRVLYQRVKMDGWNRIDAFNILANPYTTTRPAVNLGERELFTQINEPFTDDFWLTDVNLQYDFGGATLTSVTSYTSRDVLVVRDAGALTSSITGGSIGLPEQVYTLDAPLDDATSASVWTQEVRLSGEQGPARWVAGAFYSSNTRDYGQSLLVSGFEALTGIPTAGLRAPTDVLFYSDLSYELEQIAVFGEGTISVGDRLDLTAGLRYYSFNENRDQIFDGIFGNNDNGNTLVSVPGATDASGIAPRFIASFRASDQVTLNAQASKGVRLGGINDPLNVPLCTSEDLATFSGRDSWTDETAWNYEVGAKSQFSNGVGINLSAFYMDIRDLQLIVTAGSCSSRLVFNTPKARSQGIELEINASPSDQLDISFAAGLNDSQLRSTLTSTDALGNVSVVSGIEEGNRLPSVPQVQFNGVVTYTAPIGSSLGFVTGSFQHVGSRYTQIDDHAAGTGTVDLNSFGANTIGGPLTQGTFTFDPLLPAYTLANLRFGLVREGWELAVYVNNLTDERALLGLDRERGTRARVGYLTNQPRSVGFTLRFNY